MKRYLKKIIIFLILLFIIAGTVIFVKGVKTISVVSTNNSSFNPKTDKRWDILFLGNRGDKAPEGGILTDSIMVLSYNPETGEVAIISIPRDLWVKIPGYGEQKINFAYARGKAQGREVEGLKLAKKVISDVTSLDIDFVILANVEALKDVVDLIGGITIYEDKSFYADFYEHKVKIKKGVNYLNGSQALAYSGNRAIGSDFGRMERQHKVLLAIKEKILLTGLAEKPNQILNILDIVEDNFKTDLSSSQIQYLIKQAPKLKTSSVKEIIFDNKNYLYSTHTSSGIYILLPRGGNFYQIQQVCQNIFEESQNQNSMLKENSTLKDRKDSKSKTK